MDTLTGQSTSQSSTKNNNLQPIVSHEKRLACPFYQHDSGTYCEQNKRWATCAGKGFKELHHLKDHLERVHGREVSTDCTRKSEVEVIVVSRTARKRARGASKDPASAADVWNEIYGQLFPSEAPPSPYREYFIETPSTVEEYIQANVYSILISSYHEVFPFFVKSLNEADDLPLYEKFRRFQKMLCVSLDTKFVSSMNSVNAQQSSSTNAVTTQDPSDILRDHMERSLKTTPTADLSKKPTQLSDGYDTSETSMTEDANGFENIDQLLRWPQNEDSQSCDPRLLCLNSLSGT